MSSHVVIPVLAAFAVSLVLGPIVIPFLRKLKMKQTERVEGVQSHLKKAGTPTMGGIIILAAVIVTSLFYVKDYPKIIPVLFLTVACGLIGFLDDYLKVVLKRSAGWPCFQCDRSCRNIFYSCGDRNEKRDRTCHLCCSRGAAWIFTV